MGKHRELCEGDAAGSNVAGWIRALGGKTPLSPSGQVRQVLRAFTQREAEDGAVLVFSLGMEYLALSVLRKASQNAREAESVESVRVTEKEVHYACSGRLRAVFLGKAGDGGLQESLFFARNPQREQAMFGWALEALDAAEVSAGDGAGAGALSQ